MLSTGVLELEREPSRSDSGPGSWPRQGFPFFTWEGGGGPLASCMQREALLYGVSWGLHFLLGTVGSREELSSAYKVDFEKQTRPCLHRDEAEVTCGFFFFLF